jgi:uncharacterized protein
MFVMAHGAGAGMRHAFMAAMADALYREGVATTRYEFPYMREGRKRIDARPIIEATIRDAVDRVRGDLPLYAGGKSFGGRMTSHLDLDVRGMIFVGFPLHPANKPGTERAQHLSTVRVPMLFLQGTRDALCDLRRLRPVLRKLPNAQLHTIKGADHAFKVPRRPAAEVIGELARTIAQFTRPLP